MKKTHGGGRSFTGTVMKPKQLEKIKMSGKAGLEQRIKSQKLCFSEEYINPGRFMNQHQFVA